MTEQHTRAPGGTHTESGPGAGRRWARASLWLPGLAVAIGAAVATAHGLFEVALAARVPAGIAWLYPLITDGLALVAYAATARLAGGAARYAWAVVILAAGLSGLAQAAFLAGDPPAPGSVAAAAPAVLRFGVGAWPAIAAAIVAHLLYLLATDHPTPAPAGRSEPAGPVQASITVRQPSGPSRVSGPVGRDTGHSERPALDGPVIAGPSRPVSRPDPDRCPTVSRPGEPATAAGAQDRARAGAAAHRDRHGALPTVRELQSLADVGRGTAARALAQLRDTPQQAPTGLHLITDQPHDRTQP